MTAAIEVDERGVLLGADVLGGVDRPVDLLFDGQRIGSFWLVRDTVAEGTGRRWAWPPALDAYLDGRARVSVVDHQSGEELGTADARLGTSEESIRVVDKAGNPLGLDKSQRLGRLFGDRTEEHLRPLLDSIDEVVAALRVAGLDPFLAYGTLLGAVRDGGFIGHDSDADIGYVSRHTHPADAMLESFAVQRALVAQGYAITRYSGLAFKILVREADGTRRGLDVFGGFLRDGVLYLMGEVGHPFQPEWLHPTGTASLEGRSFPVPAAPDHLLEAMYGEHWRTPDPAFKFETPVAVQRRLNGWFRGTRVEREAVWDPFYARARGHATPGPSEFARHVLRSERGAGRFVDLGCGFGDDVILAARRGIPAQGLDYVRWAFARQANRARRADLPASFDWLNLTELRSSLAVGARLALDRPASGPTVVLARHVLDSTNQVGRENLLRVARMAIGGEGTLHLQFLTRRPAEGAPRGTHPIDPDRVIRTIEAAGGRVVDREDLTSDVRDPRQAPTDTGVAPYLCRMVVRWDR